MDKESKQKLLKYFFPTEEIRKVMCNDLFVELDELFLNKICIFEENKSRRKRKEHYKLTFEIILDFFIHNRDYSKKVTLIYGDQTASLNENVENIINSVIMRYVFYLTGTNSKWQNIDIFKDKRSICYSHISLADIL